MAKSYIKLWDSYDSYFEPLGAAEVGRLVLAMMKYKSSGVEPEFSGSEKFIWPAIKRDLDEDACYTEKKKASGKAGGSSKRKQTEANAGECAQTEANGSECKQTEANASWTKDVGLRTKDKKISPIGDTEKDACASASPASKKFSPPDVETVKSYFAEKGGTEAQAIRFHAYYESNGWKVGRNPMKNWKAAVTGWISRDTEQQKAASAPRNKAFMASRSPQEAAKNPNAALSDMDLSKSLKRISKA